MLIQGASGGVGSFAVQLAKYFGAKVTAGSPARVAARARSIANAMKRDGALVAARYLIAAVTQN